MLDFVRRNLSTSFVLGAFLSIAVLELSAVLYLWSDGYTSIAPHCKAIAELCGMARMAFAFLGGAACAVIAMVHAMKGDGRGVILAVAVPTIVVLGFPVMGSAERAIQRWGANRIARRAEPLIEAIAAYEEAHGPRSPRCAHAGQGASYAAVARRSRRWRLRAASPTASASGSYWWSWRFTSARTP